MSSIPHMGNSAHIDTSNFEPLNNYGIDDLEPVSTETYSSKAIKISRAITGETEIRLILETVSDGAKRYAIETVNMTPYFTSRVPAKSPRKKAVAQTEAEAITAFQFVVKNAYPVIKLRKGKTVPIHTNLL